MNDTGISGIILAGGESRRMGADKALLTVGAQPLIGRVANVMRQVVDELIIVADRPDRYPHLNGRMTVDLLPGRGPLGGIYSGLCAAHYWQSLVVACDMPFLSLQLLQYLVSLESGQDVVIPRWEELVEPLHAVYSKACLAVMEDLLSQDSLSILDVLPRVRVRYVNREEIAQFDPLLLSFANLNTPADLRWAQRAVECKSTWPYQEPAEATYHVSLLKVSRDGPPISA